MQDSWPSGADNYVLKHQIGKSTTASVWHATCTTTGEDVAIKIIDLDSCSLSIEEIRKEIQAMKLCNHANLVSYKVSFIHDSCLWLVMEYLSGGSIRNIMDFCCPNGLPEVLIATILQDALLGLEYLHNTAHTIHRDVKAGNLLVHAMGTVKLGDFGVSASMIEDGMKKRRQTFAGTPCWMAPEVVEQVNEYDSKADIWSLGITALELAKGQAPLAHHPPMKVLIMILQNPPPSAPSEGFSRAFQSFVETCLQKDPTRRPTASKLKEHRFFQQACKPELVQQSLVKNLPLLWERVRTPIDESSSSGSNIKDYSVSPNSSFTANWNFSSDVDKNDSEEFGGASDLKSNSDQLSSLQSSSNPTPTPLSSASDSAVASEKVEIKGRFIKTVISKPLTASENPADADPDDKNSTKSSFPTDPLQILTELTKQVSSMMKEIDSLKQQNASLKKEIAMLKQNS